MTTIARTNEYQDFLATKAKTFVGDGIEVALDDLHPSLFPFQRKLCQWSLRKGRAAIFADTGLGKTLMQIAWAQHIPGRVLILAPLSVAQQTITIGKSMNVPITYARTQQQASDIGITISNYEIQSHFNATYFTGVVLDESSILKSFEGVTTQALIEAFANTQYKLACTATPAPNDIEEIGNHAEFLGIMSRVEMLATFFVHDDNGWRLKGHGKKRFYEWLASWGMSVKKPSDLGDSDEGFVLPPLIIEPVIVKTSYTPLGHLLPLMTVRGITDRSQVRKDTVAQRVEACVNLVYSSWQEEKQSWDGDRKNTEHTIDEIESQSSSATRQEQRNVPQRNVSESSNITEITTQCTKKSNLLKSRARENLYPQRSKNDANSNDTITTYEIEKESSQESKSTTTASQRLNEQADLENINLLSKSTKISSNYKDTNAPFVECQPSVVKTDSTLITTTKPGSLEDYFARIVTEDSDSSEIMSIGSVMPLPTYGDHGEESGKSTKKKWILWCGLNEEQKALEQKLGTLCVSITGSMSPDEKVRREALWRESDIPVLLTKPKIFGHGMNWQHCNRMAFVGINDSFESYYQSLRRCWRFGQKQEVKAYIVVSEPETEIYENVLRKEREAKQVQEELIRNVIQYEQAEVGMTTRQQDTYQTAEAHGTNWRLLLGDSSERLQELPDNSIDLSVMSPPFSSLYVYSNSDRDLGNCADHEEFFQHYRFVIRELLRVTKPGRNMAVHVQQVATTLTHDGFIGLTDFRGDVIRAHQAENWTFHGEAVIQKNPQIQAQRTKAKALLFVQKNKDSSWSRPGLADYLLIFKKAGENAVPIKPELTNDDWITWAHPIWQTTTTEEDHSLAEGSEDIFDLAPGTPLLWYGIRESDTLNVAIARENNDERHIAPLQLETIERCIRLWSNQGETVLDPFSGLGSTGYVALRKQRRYIGIELKKSYFTTSVRNLERAANAASMPSLAAYLNGTQHEEME